MSTVTAILPTLTAVRQRRFTVPEYHRLAGTGIIGPNERCELIHGYIVEKPVINPPHASAVGKVHKAFLRCLGLDAVLRVQQPITLSDSEPEPDIVYAAGTEDHYTTNHPGPAQCLIVVEVSDSTLLEDQTTKLMLYATEKIPQYWIVNLPERRVEVYTRPRGGKSPQYRTRTDYPAEATLPVILAGKTLGTIAINEILP